MNKLTKQQRDQLISIAIGTVMVMAALWYFGVTAKQVELSATRQKSAEMSKKLHDAEALMRRGMKSAICCTVALPCWPSGKRAWPRTATPTSG